MTSAGSAAAAGPADVERPFPYIHYEVRGKGEPLVLLNGMVASGRSWPEPWLRRLEESFRLVLVDNRGTGLSSPATGPFTMADLALDVVGVLDRCGFPTVDVLGQSMGGMVALSLAMNHPERVGNLVVFAASPGGSMAVSPGPDVIAKLAALRADSSRAAEICCLASAPGFAARSPETVATLLRQNGRSRATPSVIGFQLRAMAQFDPCRLGEVVAPTLVVHGDADPLVPVENAWRLTSALPAARLAVLPGVGHLVPYESQEHSARVVADFLAAR